MRPTNPDAMVVGDLFLLLPNQQRRTSSSQVVGCSANDCARCAFRGFITPAMPTHPPPLEGITMAEAPRQVAERIVAEWADLYQVTEAGPGTKSRLVDAIEAALEDRDDEIERLRGLVRHMDLPRGE